MTSSNLQPVQGMSDIAPPEIALWQTIEEKARRVLDCYGFSELRTPMVEYTEVFTRSIGDTTDIVQKEMYSFEDRGGRRLSLRPEGTASIIRFVAGAGPEALESRYYYIGPMFRCERPQAGRKRQFHQLGTEALGQPNPAADAECLAMQLHLLSEWGLNDCTVQINTRGLPEDRKAVVEGLKSSLQPHLSELCEDCKRRFETNILRVLDCKQEKCGAIVGKMPPVTDFMSEPSRQYLNEVLCYLKVLGIPVQVNPRLVRGLDYYIHTVWELKHAALGAQDALSGGGRYQIEMGGKVIHGVGFAMGLERVIHALQSKASEIKPSGPASAWLVSLGERAFNENMVLAQMLRQRGVRCGHALGQGSMKSQMRAANRAGATWAIIRGDSEMEKGVLVLKKMSDGSQEELDMPELIERLMPANTFR